MTNYRHARMIDLIANANSPLLAVHAERCLLVRNRNAECLKCAGVCTTGAIARAEEGVRITPELCIGCGTCASACPTCCLEAQNPSDDELFATACRLLEQHAGHLVIACSTACQTQNGRSWQSGQRGRDGQEKAAADIAADAPASAWFTKNGEEAIAVACLGRIDESFLVEARAHGAQEIVLVSGTCAECARHAGGELSASICRSAENLMEAFGVTSPITRTNSTGVKLHPRPVASKAEVASGSEQTPDDIKATAVPVATAETPPSAAGGRLPSRTALAPDSKGKNGKFVHVQADGTLPHFTPQRRLRLFNSLKRFGHPLADTVSTGLWGQVSLNVDLCRSCRMCTVFCPTGALSRFDAANGTFGIEHRPTLCVQCRLCESICPEGAIEVSDTVSLEEFATGKKARIALQPIGWEPGTESSIPTRMARFIKTDTFQDPQAKMKPDHIAQQRSYAAEKQRIRNIEATRRDS